VPFLTLEDPNAKIKGSRDPLGIQPVWAQFGRRVVTNLTTQSSPVRGFTVLILGRYFTEQLIDDGKLLKEDALSAFLRMEQMGAYARHVGHGVTGDIRGIERVTKFAAEGKGRVHITPDQRGRILSDQKVYGLWGLFSVPARTSGLIADGPIGLTVATRDFVNTEYGPHLERSLRPLLNLVASDGVLKTRTNDPAFRSLKSVLGEGFSEIEADFYGRFLRDGLEVKTPHPERQQVFARLLAEYGDLDQRLGREEAVQLAEAARGTNDGLSRALDRIIHLEALLAPASVLFDFVLTQGGQRPADVAAKLQDRWGAAVPNLNADEFAEILPEIRDASRKGTAQAAARCHEALRGGSYEDAVAAVIQWNAGVSQDRQSAPWVQLERGRLDVRYRGTEQLLPDGDALPTLWRNSYFIDSLKSVIRQLQVAL
jgi:hypothetical protein